jgi:hypothetical protein
MEETMESYKLVIAFQAMEEFAQQRKARQTNAARASCDAAGVPLLNSAQRHERSRLAWLATSLDRATNWLEGRVLIWRSAQPVRPETALELD